MARSKADGEPTVGGTLGLSSPLCLTVTILRKQPRRESTNTPKGGYLWIADGFIIGSARRCLDSNPPFSATRPPTPFFIALWNRVNASGPSTYSSPVPDLIDGCV
jgi:hypothetical protein